MRSKKRSSRGRRAAEGVGTAEEEQQGEKNSSEGRRAEGEDEQQWEGAGAKEQNREKVGNSGAAY